VYGVPEDKLRKKEREGEINIFPHIFLILFYMAKVAALILFFLIKLLMCSSIFNLSTISR